VVSLETEGMYPTIDEKQAVKGLMYKEVITAVIVVLSVESSMYLT
jgi:hypothetical protein